MRAPNPPSTGSPRRERHLWRQGLVSRIGGCALTISVVFPAILPAQHAAQADAALDLYYSANGLYNRNLYTLAADQYKEFAAKYPNHEKAKGVQLGLGLSYFGMGKYAEAEPLLTKAAGEGKPAEREQAQLFSAQCFLMLNRPADAVRAFTAGLAAATEKPSREKFLAGLGEAHYQQQQWKEVLTRGAELAAMAPAAPLLSRAQFQMAVAHSELKQFKEASMLLQKCVTEKDAPFLQQATFLLGDATRELGDLETAARHFEAAAKLPGTSAPDAWFRLGFVRFQQNRPDDAARAFDELTRAHKDHPLNIHAGLYRGRIALGKNDLQQAENLLRQIPPDSTAGPEAVLWLARIQLKQKKFAEAANALAPAIGRYANDPVLPDLQLELGHALAGQNKYDEAAAAWQRLVELKPGPARTADAMRLRAYALQRAGKWQASLEQADAFLKDNPKGEGAAEVAFIRAENLFLLDQLDPAQQAYKSWLAENGAAERADAARLRLGQIPFQQQKWGDALPLLLPLAAKNSPDPFFAHAAFMAGVAAYHLKQWDVALQHLDRFVSQQPKDPQADTALFTVALACKEKGDTGGALARLQKLAAEYPASPQRPHALTELGRLQFQAKQYGPARQALTEASQLAKNDPPAPQPEYYLGWVAAAETKPEEAAQHFAAVADRFPKHPLAADARLQQATMLLQKDNFAPAQAALEQFIRDYPSDARLDQAQFHLGITHTRRKQWEQALAPLQKVVQRQPSSELAARALYELAWCAKELKRTDEAAKYYNDLLTAFAASELADPAAFELAELEFQSGKHDAVIARLEPLTGKTPDAGLKIRALYRLAWSYFAKENNTAAAAAFEGVLAAAATPGGPPPATAAYQAGEARLKLKEFDAAARHYERSLTETAGAPPPELKEQALLRIGECRTQTANWVDAQKSYAAFLAQYPQSNLIAKAHFGLGWAAENQKNYPLALDSYRKAIAASPRDETAARSQFQAGECLLATGKFDEAIKEFNNVEVNYAFPAWSSKALLEMGRCLDSKGDKTGAVARYQEVVQKYSETEAAALARQLLKDRP